MNITSLDLITDANPRDFPYRDHVTRFGFPLAAKLPLPPRPEGSTTGWQRIRNADLPVVSSDGEALSPQRWHEAAWSTPRTYADVPRHLSDLMLDFDGHICGRAQVRQDVQALLQGLACDYAVSAPQIQLRATGGSGLHLLLPAALFGNIAAPCVTAAWDSLRDFWALRYNLVSLDRHPRRLRRLYRRLNSLGAKGRYVVAITTDDLGHWESAPDQVCATSRRAPALRMQRTMPCLREVGVLMCVVMTEKNTPACG